MNYLKVLNSSFPIKLITSIFLIIIFSALISVLFFNYLISNGLGENYGQKISMLSFYRFEVLKQSFFIFIGFSLIALIGVIGFGIFYSHKVAGPLLRTGAIAKQLAEKNFDVNLKFREGDAVHLMADTLNQFARNYKEKYIMIGRNIEEMNTAATRLKELLAKGDTEAAFSLRSELEGKVEELHRLLAGVKL